MTISERILRWVVLVGVFLLPFIPLVVADHLFFPYITGKNFLFRMIVETITFCWLALALINPKYRPKRNWIFAAFLVFIIIIAVADAQGVNPFKSFWSNFERMDGWVTIAHLFCYLVVAATVINAEKLWRKLFELSLAVSLFIDLYGFAQILGVTGITSQGTAGLLARIDATFGNPIYLAVYMLFQVFIAALLINQSGKERWSGMDRILLPAGLFVGLLYIGAEAAISGGSLSWASVILYLIVMAAAAALMLGRRMWLLYSTIALDALALLFTGTRGATIGLVGGAILAGLLYVFLSREAKRARPYVVGGIVVLVVLTALVWLGRDTAVVENIGFLDRLATISTSDTDVTARFINIEIAWKGIKERPILGWGQEEYAVVWDKFYDPRLYPDEEWFDRVHDIVFDWWVAGGTLGLLSYLSVLVAYLWVLWRSRGFSIAEKSILTGLLAGYFAQNLTVFDNITSYILFGTVLAYIVWRSNEAGKPKEIPFPTIPRSAAPAIACAAAVLSLGTMWLVNGSAYEANRDILGGLSQQSAGLEQNLTEFKNAIALGTYGTQEAREQLAQVATDLASASTSQVGTSTQLDFLNTAVQQLQLQEQAAPLDARNPLFIGALLDAYGQYDQAETPLAQAHALSPDKQAILFEMGLNAQARGDSAGALSDFETAYNLDTDDLDARLYYAAAAIDAGDDTTADQLLAPVIPTGEAADQRIASAYASRGEYSKIVSIWQAAIAADPSNAQDYFTLAAAYYAAGNSKQAIAELQQAEAIDPSATAQAEQVIQEIQSGTINVQ